ncbi:MAG: hypothetical protein ACLQQ4_15355 [Bacteroidia bacterium]
MKNTIMKTKWSKLLISLIISALCFPLSTIAQQKSDKSKKQTRKEKRAEAKLAKKTAFEQRLACF